MQKSLTPVKDVDHSSLVHLQNLTRECEQIWLNMKVKMDIECEHPVYEVQDTNLMQIPRKIVYPQDWTSPCSLLHAISVCAESALHLHVNAGRLTICEKRKEINDLLVNDKNALARIFSTKS